MYRCHPIREEKYAYLSSATITKLVSYCYQTITTSTTISMENIVTLTPATKLSLPLQQYPWRIKLSPLLNYYYHYRNTPRHPSQHNLLREETIVTKESNSSMLLPHVDQANLKCQLYAHASQDVENPAMAQRGLRFERPTKSQLRVSTTETEKKVEPLVRKCTPPPLPYRR